MLQEFCEKCESKVIVWGKEKCSRYKTIPGIYISANRCPFNQGIAESVKQIYNDPKKGMSRKTKKVKK